MRYQAAEKLEIIRLIEQSSLPVRRGGVRNFVFLEPVVDERSSRVSDCIIAPEPKRRSQSSPASAGALLRAQA